MDATAANRELVERFVDLFYRRRQVREAFETCVSATHYIQHNPNMPDGREAAITMLEPKFSAPGFQADIQRVLVDGEFAVVHLHARAEPGARGAAVPRWPTSSVSKAARSSSTGTFCSPCPSRR